MHAPLHSQPQQAFDPMSEADLTVLLLSLGQGDARARATLAAALHKLCNAIEDRGAPSDPMQPQAQPAHNAVALAAELAATQLQLRDREAQFQALSRIASDFYWEQDAQYRFTRVSDGVLAATGRDAASMIGKTRWDAFGDPANDPVWRSHIAQLDTRQPFRDLEFVIRTPGRDDMYVSASGEPAFDAGGQFTGYRGIGINITARVQAQQRLRESMQLNQTLIEAAPMPMSIKDAHHRFTTVNAAYEQAFGVAREAMLGRTAAEVFAGQPSIGEQIEHEMRAAPGVRTYARPRVAADGVLHHYVLTKATLTNTAGEVTGYMTLHADVTDLKNAEREAAAQLRFTNVLLDASPTPMVVKNRDLQIALVNAAYEHMFGIQREQVLNKPIGHQRAELAAEIDRLERELLKNPGVQQSERRLPLPNGKKVDCIITKSTYLDPAGAVSGIITTFTDITDLKHTEANLIRARQQAEAAMHARSQFLANMSHEIRTPMNGVLGMASLLSATPLTDEQREFIGTIQTSGESLLKILNDILDFSKIEAGKIDIEHAPFDLHSRLTGTVQLFAAAAREKSLALNHEIAPDVPKIVRGDPVRISQALSNLIGNAIKFTQAGSVTTRLSLEARSGDALTLRFEVRDSGIGIAADVQESIFHAFSQADASTTRRFGGTGLGLSISRQLVELMGGTLSVTSTPGAGSCFSFSVKVTADAAGTRVAEASGNAAIAATRSASASRALDILLAEDNLVNQTVATAMLKKLGCNITLARNGREAIAAAKVRHFDLILMDCHMPEIDGFEATIEIRALESGGNPRHIIVAQTANAMEGDRESCLAAGMDDYIAKPYSTEKLAALLERWRNTA